MRAGGGKEKGGAYERKINQQLSLWLSGGEKKDCLKRSSSSGARATMAYKKGDILKNESGDATAIDEIAFPLIDRYFLEYKNYKNLNILSFLLKNTGELARFWRVARKQSKQYGKKPILIFKQNYLPDMILLDKKYLEDWSAGNMPQLARKRLTSLSWDDLCSTCEEPAIHFSRKNLRIYQLAHFLDYYEFDKDYPYFIKRLGKETI